MNVPSWPPPQSRPPVLPQPPKPEDDETPRWQAIRDVLLFAAWLLILVNELVIVESPRLEALVLAAMMLGLPAVFRIPKDGT